MIGFGRPLGPFVGRLPREQARKFSESRPSGPLT